MLNLNPSLSVAKPAYEFSANIELELQRLILEELSLEELRKHAEGDNTLDAQHAASDKLVKIITKFKPTLSVVEVENIVMDEFYNV